MKYIVASDIHGDLEGALSIKDAFNYHNADHILLLGDLLYHGPRNTLPEHYNPKEVIPILNSLSYKITAVRGNCDAEVDQMVLEFPISADYQVIPFHSHHIFISHGHIYGPDHYPNLEEGDIFLFGHIHIPVLEQVDGHYIFNPSSISLPKENHPRTYAVLDDEGFTVYTLDHEEYLSMKF